MFVRYPIGIENRPLYVNDTKEYILCSVSYQRFADDIKIYHEIRSEDDCATIQYAADQIAR